MNSSKQKIDNSIIEFLDAKSLTHNENIQNWINTVCKNEIKKIYNRCHYENNGNYYSERYQFKNELEHIIDYLNSSRAPKRILQLSYQDAHRLSQEWIVWLNKKSSTYEDENDIEVMCDLSDGYKLVSLITKQAYKREGKLMEHCVANHSIDTMVYSVRTPENIPVCTIEIGKYDNNYDMFSDDYNESESESEIKYHIADMKGFDNKEVGEEHTNYCLLSLQFLIEKYSIENENIKYLEYINCIKTNIGIFKNEKNIFLNYETPIHIMGGIELEDEKVVIGENYTFDTDYDKPVVIKAKEVVLKVNKNSIYTRFVIDAQKVTIQETSNQFNLKLLNCSEFICPQSKLIINNFSLKNCNIKKLSNLESNEIKLNKTVVDNILHSHTHTLTLIDSKVNFDLITNQIKKLKTDKKSRSFFGLNTLFKINYLFKSSIYYIKKAISSPSGNFIIDPKADYSISQSMSRMIRMGQEMRGLPNENMVNLPVPYGKSKSKKDIIAENFYNYYLKTKHLIKKTLNYYLKKRYNDSKLDKVILRIPNIRNPFADAGSPYLNINYSFQYKGINVIYSDADMYPRGNTSHMVIYDEFGTYSS